MKESPAKVKECLIYLRRLNDILLQERESNWARAIQGVIYAGESIKNSDAALAEMASLYRSMHGGRGSFGDYFIWRDNFEERKKANMEFEVLASRLWEKLILTAD